MFFLNCILQKNIYLNILHYKENKFLSKDQRLKESSKKIYIQTDKKDVSFYYWMVTK